MEDAIKYIEERGYKFVKHNERNKVILIQCPNNHVFSVFPDRLNNFSCYACTNTDVNIETRVLDIISKYDCEVVTGNEFGLEKEITVKCSAGHIFTRRCTYIIGGYLCGICEKISSPTFVEKLIKARNYTYVGLIGTRNLGRMSYQIMLCPRGHIYSTAFFFFRVKGYDPCFCCAKFRKPISQCSDP